MIKYFFFAIAVCIIAVVPAASADQSTVRYKDHEITDYHNGTYTQTLGMQEYVWDGTKYVDRIIANNGTHFNVYSAMGSFSFNKNTCTITQYAKGFNPITGTAKDSDIIIQNWFWTIARKNGANPWSVIDASIFNCVISTSSNATGKYLDMKRTDTSSGSYLRVNLAAPNGQNIEDYSELYMNKTAWNGNKFAFVLWAKNVKVDSLTFRNGTTISIPNGVTIIDKSQLNVDSMDFVKNGNAFFFDWKKAKTNFKSLVLNKTGSNIDVQFGFNDNAATLSTGQKMYMDPTYGYSGAGSAIHVQSAGVASVSCNNTPYTKGTSTTLYRAQSGSASECFVKANQWDTTTIPDGSLVTNTNFRYDITAVALASNCDYTQVTHNIVTNTAETLWNDIVNTANGSTYVSNNNGCTTVANDKVLDLGTTADADVQSGLTSNIFQVGIKWTSMVRDGNTLDITFGNAANMELQVTYTLPTPPNAVTVLSAGNETTTTVDLAWTAPSGNGFTITGYRINDTTPWGTPLTILSPDPTGTTSTRATISGLTVNTPYSFRVTAITSAGKNVSGAAIANTTTLAFNAANFTVGSLSFDATNPNATDIWFIRDDIDSDSLFLNVTYPETWELACDFHYQYAMDNRTYRNLSTSAYDSSHVTSYFRFDGVDNEIINVDCWDQNGTGGQGTYLITQTNFILLQLIQNFTNGEYGTQGNFGSINLVYLVVIIVSMIGLNRVNESVAAGFCLMITVGCAYFGIISIPTAAISGIALVMLLLIITTRKD